MSDIGDRIKKRRIELGLSQDELAAMLGYKSRSSINKIERDGQNLPQPKIVEIARALFVSPSYIMGWEQSPELFYGIDSKIFNETAHLMVSKEEEALIKKYRQLDTDGKKNIERQLEFELYRMENSPEEKEGALG